MIWDSGCRIWPEYQLSTFWCLSNSITNRHYVYTDKWTIMILKERNRRSFTPFALNNCCRSLRYFTNFLFSHRRSSSTKDSLQMKLVFHRKSSSTEGHLPPKLVFRCRLSSTESCLPPMGVFHRRSSSIKGRLPPTITPGFILYLWEQSTYQISASYQQYIMLDSWCMMHDAWCMM